jgi:hypothetical protein
LFLFDIFSKEFGYTLIGEKPVSLTEIPRKLMDEKYEKYLLCLKNIFNQSPNFALKICNKGPPHYVSLTLINKKALQRAVNLNPLVGSFIRTEFQIESQFYLLLENSMQGLAQIVRDERIIGYLLGYSKSDIEYYMRRMELGRYLQKYPLYMFHPLPGGRYYRRSLTLPRNVSPSYTHIKPRKRFTSLETEWQWIQDVAWDLRKEGFPTPPYFVSLPVYICRHGNDSKLARERFQEASYKVAELFYKKTFREAISEEAQKPY